MYKKVKMGNKACNKNYTQHNCSRLWHFTQIWIVAQDMRLPNFNEAIKFRKNNKNLKRLSDNFVFGKKGAEKRHPVSSTGKNVEEQRDPVIHWMRFHRQPGVNVINLYFFAIVHHSGSVS
jgi:hypothetical protein